MNRYDEPPRMTDLWCALILCIAAAAMCAAALWGMNAS